MISFDIVQKAILLESNYLLGHQKNGADMKATTMKEVVAFYTQLRESFQFEISYASIIDDLSYDDRVKSEKQMSVWAQKNNILMFRDRAPRINYFSTEADVVAFKLRWL